MLRNQEIQQMQELIGQSQKEFGRPTMDERINNVPVNGNKSSMIPGVPMGKCTLWRAY